MSDYISSLNEQQQLAAILEASRHEDLVEAPPGFFVCHTASEFRYNGQFRGRNLCWFIAIADGLRKTAEERWSSRGEVAHAHRRHGCGGCRGGVPSRDAGDGGLTADLSADGACAGGVNVSRIPNRPFWHFFANYHRYHNRNVRNVLRMHSSIPPRRAAPPDPRLHRNSRLLSTSTGHTTRPQTNR